MKLHLVYTEEPIFINSSSVLAILNERCSGNTLVHLSGDVIFSVTESVEDVRTKCGMTE